ncbi:MAG: hypothetical protein IT443_07950 [Phycisphaeraceae bacterium]|nr:hypothetical protein [Phycisphaeraceae bacterium]
MATSILHPSDPLTLLSASELLHLIASGQVSSRQVTEAHIHRIEQVNPLLNAVVVPLFDSARRQALAADEAQARRQPLGPLHGLPMTVKEAFALAGSPHTAGVVRHAGTLAPADCPLVRRLRAAGAVFLGKTNLPQLMVCFESDNPLYGRTNHPLDLSRSPGGSSGGEAAIIAAHGSPLGLASDGGGSIRQPSHVCGLYGLRPSSGRLSMIGHSIFSDGSVDSAVQGGPIARCVADLRLAMSVLAAPGLHLEDPLVENHPWPAGLTPSPVAGLRVGYFEFDGFFRPSPAIQKAVRRAAQTLQAAGAILVPFIVPQVHLVPALYLATQLARNAPQHLREFLGSDAPERRARFAVHPPRIAPVVLQFLVHLLPLLGQKRLAQLLNAAPDSRLDDSALAQIMARRRQYQQTFLQAMHAQQLDAILGPTHGLPALTHGDANIGAFAGSYTLLYSLLGFPAGNVPAGLIQPADQTERGFCLDYVERSAARIERGSAGLPIGVQIAAPPWCEDRVLNLMSALESLGAVSADACSLSARP